MAQSVGPSKRAQAVRAQAVRSAMANKGSRQQRGNRLLVLDSPVELVTNGEGEVIGVDVWVRLFENGTEVPIDPHRIFINPPTSVVDVPAKFDENGELVSPRVTRQAPDEAFWDVLWENVTSTPNPQGWRTSGTVTTVFASTADGVISSTDSTYSNARTGSGLTALTSGAAGIVGQALVSTNYQCSEMFVSFDTSAIADTDVVQSVQLDLWLSADNSDTDFVVEAREFDWGTTLTTADWVAGASLGSNTLMATLNTNGIGSTGAYKTFNSQAAFLSATNLKTGTVSLMLSSSRHRLGNTPTGLERVAFSMADASGTTQDPKLTITHASPPTANAGADQTVKEGATVNLDGTGSSDPEDAPSGDPTGTLLSYDWTVADDGGTGLTTGDLTGRTTATPSFTAPAVAADANITLQLEVTDSDGLTDTDTVVVTVQAAEAEITGSGGLLMGGQATTFFGSGVSASVPSDIVVEWDFDNDGDFSEDVEDITAYVLQIETMTGRDWPSQLTGKAGPGKLRATLRNDDDRFSFFNASSPLNQDGLSLRTGRKIRVRTRESVKDLSEVAILAENPDNYWACDEESGVILADAGSGASDALLTGSYTLGGAEFNASPAVAFNGGYAVSSEDPYVPGNEDTIAFWAKIEPGDHVAFMTAVGAGTNTWDFRFDSTTRVRCHRVTTATNRNVDITPPAAVDDGKWHHYCAVFDANVGELRTYFDGSPQGSTSWTPGETPTTLTSALTIGAATDTGSRPFFGAIADVATFSRALSASEVQALYEAGVQGLTRVDPVLLARDRFSTSGSLTVDELGNSWSQPLADDFTVSGGEAAAVTEGSEHIAVLDVGTADYYAQVKLAEVGAETTGRTGNVVGLVYRYQDSNNYSLAVLDVDAAELQLIDVVAGTPTKIASEAVEPYDNMTIGVLVSGSTVTFYHEGVAVFSDTAIQTDETEVGIYASWGTGQPAPAFDDFYVWDGLPSEVEGILWTGEISKLTTTVIPGPRKLATIEGIGVLSRLANQRVKPPSTVQGRKTGVLVGNTLAMAKLLHPPGPIDEGDVTTGPFGMGEVQALEAVRRFEETEFGFLYETQEGYIGFDSRSARDGATVAVTFSDADGAQFGYSALTPFDWKREIVNRVFAGVAGDTPSGVTVTNPTPTGNFSVAMPSTVNKGDLLVVVASGRGLSSSSPLGWERIYGTGGSSASGHAWAKVAEGNEGGTSVEFAETAFELGVVFVYRITSWFGSISDGISVSGFTTGTATGLCQPVFPTWGPQPSLFIANLHAYGVAVPSAEYPVGYTNGQSRAEAAGPSTGTALFTATRLGCETIERPEYTDISGPAICVPMVIAIRGFNGDPPVSSGVAEVQLDDTDSQDEHNAIRTYRNSANLFATRADATTYGNLVLARHADDRPILSLTFYATKSAAYRAQAIRRRVGHKIHLVASHRSGMGIDGDFFIESITHRWSQGRTLWEVTWELSPAD